MRDVARVTILNAHIFTATGPADFYPSSAVQLPTVRLIAMASCADMKRDSRTIRTISLADGFTGSSRVLFQFVRLSSLVAKDRTEDGCDRNGGSDAYEDNGQLRVSMTAVVVDVLHVRITNGR